MKEYIGNNYCDAYRQALTDLYNHPDFISSPRGMKIKENLDVRIQINDITQNLFKNSIRSVPLKYLKKELALYLCGRRDANGFVEASKFWDNIKNNDGTINSAYGYLIFKPSTKDGKAQFDWAYESLKNDKDSRQAIMFYNRPEFQYDRNKDFVCTFNNIFHIRDNKLYMSANMRSNDVIRGTTFDIPWFMLVQYMMYLKLKENDYPDLELGPFIHSAASFHVYERDFKLVEDMINGVWETDSFVLPDNGTTLLDDVNEAIEGKQDLFDFANNADFIEWLLEV